MEKLRINRSESLTGVLEAQRKREAAVVKTGDLSPASPVFGTTRETMYIPSSRLPGPYNPEKLSAELAALRAYQQERNEREGKQRRSICNNRQLLT